MFNGLIRDCSNLCKIAAALQAGVAWEDKSSTEMRKYIFQGRTNKKEANFHFKKVSLFSARRSLTSKKNTKQAKVILYHYFSVRYTDKAVIWVEPRSILIELLSLMLLPGRICGQHNSVKLQYSLTSNFLCMFSHARWVRAHLKNLHSSRCF